MTTSSKPSLYSLYIHWPFCSKKCYYCDFVAFEQHEDIQDAYHVALMREIEHFVSTDPFYQPNISTIFIGGGTPSLYSLERMEELFVLLNKHFNLDNLEELAMEANPADITEERLDAWSSFGINRLSIGVQVLDDEVLLKLNRRQRTMDVHNALRIVPKYFDNFSLDFIVGLPGVKEQTWYDSIDVALQSQAQHISIYFLTVHEKTPLYFKTQSGELKLHDDDTMIDLYEKTIKKLADNGFEQYELSNFSRPGYQSAHNKGYWNQKPYKGFGIGACSFDGNIRFINEKNVTTYLSKVENNDYTGILKAEVLSAEQIRIETLMLGLRQTKGMGLHRMVYLLGCSEKKRFLDNLKLLKDQGLIKEHDGHIALTLKGMALEHEVILKLI